MSSRRPQPAMNADASRLRSELEHLKQQSALVEAAGTAAQEGLAAPVSKDGIPAFDQLSGTEQAAGSLGVHPQAWKPIKFMNNAHFEPFCCVCVLFVGVHSRCDKTRIVLTE